MFSRRLIAALLLVVASLTSSAADVIDINSADVDDLVQLKGIGRHKAAAIVAYREQFGAFETIEALTAVNGIGKRTVEMNRGALVAGPPTVTSHSTP